jgi:hypothetical protein
LSLDNLLLELLIFDVLLPLVLLEHPLVPDLLLFFLLRLLLLLVVLEDRSCLVEVFFVLLKHQHDGLTFYDSERESRLNLLNKLLPNHLLLKVIGRTDEADDVKALKALLKQLSEVRGLTTSLREEAEAEGLIVQLVGGVKFRELLFDRHALLINMKQLEVYLSAIVEWDFNSLQS